MTQNKYLILKENLVNSTKILTENQLKLPRKVLVLGGSGFIGNWVVGILSKYIFETKLNSQLFIQTSRKSFVENTWHLALNNDVGIFIDKIPLNSKFDLVLDLRLPPTGQSNKEQLFQSKNFYKNFFECITMISPGGTLIIPSSGAVYGNLKSKSVPLCEELNLQGDFDLTVYGETKLSLETLGTKVASNGLKIIMPRIFSTFGPLMRIDSPLIGNIVIKQAVELNEIQLNSPIGVFRDFIYITDLIIQILSLVELNMEFINLNLGSHNILEINDFAKRIASITNSTFSYKNGESQNDHYYPCLHKLEILMPHLVLNQQWNLEANISQTIEFYRSIDV